MTEFLPWIALALALFPIGFAIDNLRRMAKARGPAPKDALVSILIPARNEEAHISTCLDAALAQQLASTLRKSTLRKLWGALHIQNDRMAFDLLVNEGQDGIIVVVHGLTPETVRGNNELRV
jgi:cellulose synthase/poly-beta-1,6-N-acetylglucosamine synthase-like glycosyltransferase